MTGTTQRSADIVDDDGSSCASHRDSYSAADTSAGTCNDNHLTLQKHGTPFAIERAFLRSGAWT
jgi:hypothetical protein